MLFREPTYKYYSRSKFCDTLGKNVRNTDDLNFKTVIKTNRVFWMFPAVYFSGSPFGAGIIFFLILAHPVYKMWIIQETITLELWNKLHFEEDKKTESIYRV